MKSRIRFLIPLLLAVLMLSLAGAGAARAQGPIWAEVDRTALSTGETVVLSVTINADSILNAPRPALPPLQGFNIVGSSTSSQISIVNGSMSSLAVYSYRLQPYETGDLVIEPISVNMGGQSFSTQPITIQVSQGAAPAAAPAGQAAPAPSQSESAAAPPAEELAGQDLHVEAEVSNATPYVGEQVTYTFRFYRAINLRDQPQFQSPTFTGFWSEHQSEQQDYQIQAAGRVYRVSEVETILFPSIMGPVTIDAARLVIPGGFFSRGTTLQTRPVELDVLPLPPNAPPGFNGAVGHYTLAGSLDTTQGKVDEPLTWRVSLSGQGNMTAAPDPIWPEMPGWRAFESQASVHSEVMDGVVVGNRTYERLLVPSAQGDFTIPALEYVYLDPNTGEYQTVRTEPVAVSIAPGAAGASAPPPTGAQKETVEQVGNDIRHLKAVPEELEMAAGPVTASTLYWAAWLFPVFGAAGYFVWQRRQRFWENNLGLARSSQARKKAKRALSQARRQKPAAFETAGQILLTYLSDKLDRPVTGLTHQALATLLTEQGIGLDLIERVEVLQVSSELGRYAPGADDPGHAASLLDEVGILIDALEKAL